MYNLPVCKWSMNGLAIKNNCITKYVLNKIINQLSIYVTLWMTCVPFEDPLTYSSIFRLQIISYINKDFFNKISHKLGEYG